MKRKRAPQAHGARAQRREAIADTSIPLAERLQIERKQIFKAMGNRQLLSLRERLHAGPTGRHARTKSH